MTLTPQQKKELIRELKRFPWDIELLKQAREELDELIKINDVETVRSLRQKGYKVKVHHFRDEIYFDATNTVMVLEPKGGATNVTVTSPEGVFGYGEAVCSLKDNYCKKTGVKIALKRALENLEKNKKGVNPFSDEYDEKGIADTIPTTNKLEEILNNTADITEFVLGEINSERVAMLADSIQKGMKAEGENLMKALIGFDKHLARKRGFGSAGYFY